MRTLLEDPLQKKNYPIYADVRDDCDVAHPKKGLQKNDMEMPKESQDFLRFMDWLFFCDYVTGKVRPMTHIYIYRIYRLRYFNQPFEVNSADSFELCFAADPNNKISQVLPSC